MTDTVLEADFCLVTASSSSELESLLELLSVFLVTGDLAADVFAAVELAALDVGFLIVFFSSSEDESLLELLLSAFFAAGSLVAGLETDTDLGVVTDVFAFSSSDDSLLLELVSALTAVGDLAPNFAAGVDF